MSGGPGNDVQHGGPGNDTIYANRGADESFGDDGDDNLWAMARADVTADGDATVDTLHGGPGNDTFHTRDGEADKIDCGDGNDTAILDTKDVIVDATAQNPNGSCETVIRREPRSREDRQETKNQSSSEDNASTQQ
jgi:Ca2+-binding RTX toxin-like protein